MASATGLVHRNGGHWRGEGAGGQAKWAESDQKVDNSFANGHLFANSKMDEPANQGQWQRIQAGLINRLFVGQLCLTKLALLCA